MNMSYRVIVFSLLIAFLAAASHAAEPVFKYVPNPLETTPFGPAKADILLRPSNFLPCYGGPISLCYYSGPPAADSSQPDLSCEVTEGGDFANCRCIVIPNGPYFVDINAILDVKMYKKTTRACKKDGVDCRVPNSAPVCRAINRGTYFPSADTVSTFSLALDNADSSQYTVDPQLCEQEALYAGCMTAPCEATSDTIEINGSDYPISECACPTFEGPYQVGQPPVPGCTLGNGEAGDNVWSAAFNPLGTGTVPGPGCIPDAPNDDGCPLLSAVPDSDPLEVILPEVPSNVRCRKVCSEYRRSQKQGVEVGFTCDATLCTAAGRDFDLVNDACSGLGQGRSGLSKILLLEAEVGCSCCASQICGCEPRPQTNEKIFELNERQRDRNIVPQCDQNGTLCGSLR
jgi:hypothetical protein